MALLAPPPRPPQVAVGLRDEDARRFRRRVTLTVATVLTVLGTGWVCTFGIIPAIIALSVAKHVLVAILMMGIGVDAPAKQRR